MRNIEHRKKNIEHRQYNIENGTSFLVALGTTAEAATLSSEEKKNETGAKIVDRIISNDSFTETCL